MTSPEQLVEVLGPIDGRYVVVIRGEFFEEDRFAERLVKALGAAAEARGESGPAAALVPLVVCLDPDQDMKLLDEEAMAREGWVRIERVQRG